MNTPNPIPRLHVPTPAERIRAAAKAIVAVVVPIVVGLITDLLSDAQTTIPGIITGVLTGAGVYAKRNTPVPEIEWR